MENMNTIEKIQELCKVLKKEVPDAIPHLVGYLFSGDASYLRVLTGENRLIKQRFVRSLAIDDVISDIVDAARVKDSELQALWEVLEAEGHQPRLAISGYVLSGDPSYLRVHTGGSRELKHSFAHRDLWDLLEEWLRLII